MKNFKVRWDMTRKTLLLAGIVGLLASGAHAQAIIKNEKAPELIGSSKDWINGKPVKLADLKGKVVVVCYWTFACINCKRTLPYWNEWAKKYANTDVVFVTIHTPEGNNERVVAEVRKVVAKKQLVFPVLIDNDKANWNKWSNQYWPATYLIDKKGVIRNQWDGELNYNGSGEYKQVLQGIEQLRNEKP